jgi:hypothetical protein
MAASALAAQFVSRAVELPEPLESPGLDTAGTFHGPARLTPATDERTVLDQYTLA